MNHPRPQTQAAIDALYARVMELHAMGWTRRDIAEEVNRTPQRVGQIVNTFGVYPRGRYRKGGDSRTSRNH